MSRIDVIALLVLLGALVKDGLIELQGDHLGMVESALRGLGYKTRRQ